MSSRYIRKDGLVTPEYITGLINREQQSATYLGQGIAIPHGTPQSREYILKQVSA